MLHKGVIAATCLFKQNSTVSLRSVSPDICSLSQHKCLTSALTAKARASETAVWKEHSPMAGLDHSTCTRRGPWGSEFSADFNNEHVSHLLGSSSCASSFHSFCLNSPIGVSP